MDKKHWAAMECENGHVYYDADISANARVQEIMIRAQANKTELGYWREIATDLAALIDELELELQHWQESYEAEIRTAKEEYARLECDIAYWKNKFHYADNELRYEQY